MEVILVRVMILGLGLLSWPAWSQTAHGKGASTFELFIGTGASSPPINNKPHLVDVNSPNNSMAIGALDSLSVSAAAYDPIGNRILFTSNTATVFETDLWEWVVGSPAPNLLGLIRTDTGDLTIDGMAFYRNRLFGVHQTGDPAGVEGLYEISLSPGAVKMATLLVSWPPTERSINGLGIDPRNGRIYAADDTTQTLVEILLSGTITTVANYPTLTETDLDGLAVGDDGRVYLIPDDNDPGDIYIYNLDQGFPETPIRAPFTGSDPASSGAYLYSVPELIFFDGFE